MGTKFSQEQKQHFLELKELTSQRTFNYKSHGSSTPAVKSSTLKDLLIYIYKSCPTYPAAGSLKTATWRQIGQYLHASPRAPGHILATWRIVMECVNDQESSHTSAPTAPPPYTNETSNKNPPKPSNSNKKQVEQPDVNIATQTQSTMGAVGMGLAQAKKDGDMDLEGLASCCATSLYPVIQVNDANGVPRPQFEPLPVKLIKDLKHAVSMYGVSSPFTRGMLQNTAAAYNMLPQDWRDLFRMILTGPQYLLWEKGYQLASVAAVNQANNAQITSEMVYGGGAFSGLIAQLQLTNAALNLTGAAAMVGLQDVTDPHEVQSSFSKICQAPSQPYADFVDDLQKAIERQITNHAAQKELLLKLAMENANTDCQRVLQPIAARPESTIADFLKACRIVGTSAYKMDALAAAINQGNQSQTRSSGNCFNCGKPGHFRSQCRAPGGGASRQALRQGKRSNPKSLCPRCGKGYHWAAQCRSNPPPSQNSGN